MKMLLTLVLLFAISLCYGQYRHKLINDTTTYDKYPFAIISDNQHTYKAYSYIIDYGYLIYNKTDSSGKYSPKGDCIEIYGLKPTVTLLNLDQLLTKKRIKLEYRNLPAYIDSNIIRHRETACFQLSAVVSVKVQTNKLTHLKYINIRSIHHTDNPISDIYIIGATLSKPEIKIEF
jgi:hypothetical protein